VDAIEILESDHRRVEQLFDRFRGAEGDAREKGRVVDQVIRELSVHAAIEEEIFYPAVRAAVAGGDDLVEHSLEEHREVKELLAELGTMSPDDPAFDPKVEKVISDVSEHVKEEEGDHFPRLRQAISANELLEMGAKLEAGKKRAPTRPHPHVPATPPGNIVAGGAASAIDKLRDKMKGRESA
jgi:hemerythrin superfamily protein